MGELGWKVRPLFRGLVRPLTSLARSEACLTGLVNPGDETGVIRLAFRAGHRVRGRGAAESREGPAESSLARPGSPPSRAERQRGVNAHKDPRSSQANIHT